ncbi:MAG: hypothetical protein E6I84_01985 [Chloroflexi bacterium]|nr:MAG: hypothetical protein E6I84_01985 [Chloroflexota bacterium]
MAHRRSLRRPALAVGLLAIVLLAVGLVEGDLAEDLTHLGGLVIGLLNRFGAAACLALIYVEESGIPLPVPGDFYVGFMGKLFAASLPSLVGAWLGIVAVVVAGASNLYWISRRWGPALIRQPLVGGLLGLEERRLARASQWFERWGALAIIFGRHLPGFRIPITVIAATLGVPYRHLGGRRTLARGDPGELDRKRPRSQRLDLSCRLRGNHPGPRLYPRPRMGRLGQAPGCATMSR